MNGTIFKLNQSKPYNSELHVNKIYITHVQVIKYLELYTKHKNTYIYIKAILNTYIKRLF